MLDQDSSVNKPTRIAVTAQAPLAVTIVFARRKAKLNEIFQRIQGFNCS